MSPAEDAALLLGIVERHLVVLRLGLGDEFPEEEWGFLAQQATEKLLKAVIVAANQAPPQSHDLDKLASAAGVAMAEALLDLQVFAVEARYEEGPFPLPASKTELLGMIEQLRQEIQGLICS
jgi:HEPN domain-containing protein